MVESRIIPGIQELIRAETAVRNQVAVNRLRLLQEQARVERNGMVIAANSGIVPELPEALRKRVAGGATIIIDYTGGLIIHQNGNK